MEAGAATVVPRLHLGLEPGRRGDDGHAARLDGVARVEEEAYARLAEARAVVLGVPVRRVVLVGGEGGFGAVLLVVPERVPRADALERDRRRGRRGAPVAEMDAARSDETDDDRR